MKRLLLPLLLLACMAAAAEHPVTTADGDEIPVTVTPADGGSPGGALILWVTSEFGATPRRAALARALAAQGIEVWSPDLHAAWFLPVGRYSLNDVDPAALAAVLQAALAATDKPVYLMAEGRSVALALAAVRHWQGTTDDTAQLRGLFAFNPRLFVRTPQGGEPAEYLPVARASNLPVYILQPVDSSGFWHVARDMETLAAGGASVFLHRLADVSDGFHVRPDYSDAEAAATARLPAILRNAMQLLDAYGGTPAEPAALPPGPAAPLKPTGSMLLRPYPGERQAPGLRLASLRHGEIDLRALAGQVVLVNFWATWCPPCIEEIPSLQRLYRRLGPQGLEILAVDVGESVEVMQRFLADKPVDFPVLMDRDGEALRRWGVYAFPTTLVVDRRQRLRYAVFGAFDWSSDEVIETLRPLLAEPAD